jgi:hypothetical protein
MGGLEAKTWSSLDTMMPINSALLMILMYLKISLPRLPLHNLNLLLPRQMNTNHSQRRRETMNNLLHLKAVPLLTLRTEKKNLKRKRKKDLNSRKKLKGLLPVALLSLLQL